MKHTKGKWKIDIEGDGNIWISTDKPEMIANISCSSDGGLYYPTEEEKANAELIVEAGNVTNETGCTPRQLADQKAELLGALKTTFDLIDRGFLVRDISKDHDFKYFTKQGTEINNAIVLINEAIKKAI